MKRNSFDKLIYAVVGTFILGVLLLFSSHAAFAEAVVAEAGSIKIDQVVDVKMEATPKRIVYRKKKDGTSTLRNVFEAKKEREVN